MLNPQHNMSGIELQDVQNALNKLPPVQREMLMLVAAEGVSYEEAAIIAGCAIGTVKSRVARARAALVRLMDGHEIDPDVEDGDQARPLHPVGFGFADRT